MVYTIIQVMRLNSKPHITQLKGSFQNYWLFEIDDYNRNPKLKSYSLLKMTFGLGPYLTIVKGPHYIDAITRLRSGSHNLEIESGRQCIPKIPPKEQLCHVCRSLKDEKTSAGKYNGF